MMGEFANSRLTVAVAWFVTAAIIGLNALLLVLIFRGAA
jgi:Mn2+/Fe2+ NRAMP family transporter